MAGEHVLPGIGLKADWNLGSNNWKEDMDTNLLTLSLLVNLIVLSRSSALPASPAEGDLYLVLPGDPTHPNEIAVYYESAWVYLVPVKGYKALVSDETLSVWYNGSDWVSTASSVDTPYDVGGSFAGPPTFDLVLLRYPFPREVVFPTDLVGSHAVAETGATAETVFILSKNGTLFGTMTFPATGNTAVFSGAETTFLAGDILTVKAPSIPDATLSDLGFSLAGDRII